MEGINQSPLYIGNLDDFVNFIESIKADDNIFSYFAAKMGLTEKPEHENSKFKTAKIIIKHNGSAYYNVTKKTNNMTVSMGLPTIEALFNFENELLPSVTAHFQTLELKIKNQFQLAAVEMKKKKSATATVVCNKVDLLALINSCERLSNEFILHTVANFFNIFRTFYYI